MSSASAFEAAFLAPGEWPSVSVVIVVRNGMPYIQDAVRSVIAQNYPRVEILVQDGLSTDGTLDYLATQHDKVLINLESKQDRGIGDAGQRSIERARGEIITFLDADNEVAGDALYHMALAFRREPQLAVVFGDSLEISDDGKPLGLFQPPPYDYLEFLLTDQVPPWNACYFHRANCGADLTMDRDCTTLGDMSTFLKVALKPIKKIDALLTHRRQAKGAISQSTKNSPTLAAERARLVAEHAAAHWPAPLATSLARHGAVGAYCWIAEAYASSYFDQLPDAQPYLLQAAQHSLRSDRLRYTMLRVQLAGQQIREKIA